MRKLNVGIVGLRRGRGFVSLFAAHPQLNVTALCDLNPATLADLGEAFAQLGLDIKQRSPYAMTAVAELGADIIGYIPTLEAFRQGGYETFRSRWA